MVWQQKFGRRLFPQEERKKEAERLERERVLRAQEEREKKRLRGESCGRGGACRRS